VKEALSKYGENEKNISIEIESVDGECELFTREDSAKILELIRREHYGPIAMSEDFPSLVETSMNLGVISSEGSEFSLYASIRSSEEKKKAEALEKAKKIAEELGFEVTTQGAYPGWAYKKISPLRDKLCEKFYELFGREAKTIIIHAGLECGIFADKISDLDCVSMGPIAYDIHTPKERLSISSAIRVYRLLCEALSNI
jgi:dipeptidase D